MKRYCVATGRVLERRTELAGRSPHYQILLQAGHERFRVAINTRSGSSHGRRAELLFFADDDFRHELTTRLAEIGDGVREIPSHRGGLALDYQRGGMFDRRQMRRIPAVRPGPHNDLIEELDERIDRAMVDPAARLHAYGTRWGPEPHFPDQVFHFLPGNGVHDVHMNQGSRDEHAPDNGIWRDGGLIFHEPRHRRWSAIFLAFQTQSWQTDVHGDPLLSALTPAEALEASLEAPTPLVSLVAAFVHPNDSKTGVEHVTIQNAGDLPLLVEGWQVRNDADDVLTLSGVIPAHQARRFDLPRSVPLSADGGVIRLLDPAGQEVDRVTYTRRQAARRRGAITF